MCRDLKFLCGFRFIGYQLFLSALLLVLILNPTPVSAAGAVMFVADSSWDADERREIHLMQPNGKSHRRLQPGYPLASATMSPKGDKIVYERLDRDELRSVDINGKNDRKFIEFSTGPDFFTSIDSISWSPNGRFIAYGHTIRKTSGVFNAVSLIDYASRRIIKTFEISLLPDPTVAVNQISELRWSPNSKTLLVYELGFIPVIGSFPIFFEKSFTVNTRTGVVTVQGEFEAHDFLGNNKVLGLLEDDGIGAVNFGETRGTRLVNPGSNRSIDDIIAVGSNALIIQIDNLREQFEAGDTDLSALRGKSRSDEVGYDFVHINLRTKVATFITPANDSFDADKPGYFSMDFRKRAQTSMFRTDTCWGWVVTIKGTNRRDRINGTPLADVIHGRAGNDTINGRGGDDVLCGGRGNDQLIGKGGNNVLFGDVELNVNNAGLTTRGKDRLTGGKEVDTLYGQSGNDLIRGGGGDDFLDGGSGDDVIDGQTGDDRINGGDGNDRCTNYDRSEQCE